MRIIAGEFAGRHLTAPKNEAIRPTTDRNRESLFNVLTHLQEGFFVQKNILDLFAGTGALGLEALSRGAKKACFIDKSPIARRLIAENVAMLSVNDRTIILSRDATNLGILGDLEPFDIVFADPPYGKMLGAKAFLNIIEKGWAKEKAFFILEEVENAVFCPIKDLILLQKKRYGQTIFSIYQKE